MMKGDKCKPENSFMRWIDHFWDGCFSSTKKGKNRIPSQGESKRKDRRWRRRKEKQDMIQEIQEWEQQE